MYYGLILIDVNGEKGPNTVCTNAQQPTDTYVATMYGNRVVAGAKTVLVEGGFFVAIVEIFMPSHYSTMWARAVSFSILSIFIFTN